MGTSWKRLKPGRLDTPQLLAVARLVPLHAGEIEALHIATEHPGALLLTDDTAARLAARSLDIPVHGTAWCLRSIRISKDPSNAPPERALAPFRLDRFAAADGGVVLSAVGTVAALAAIIELWSPRAS